jgi:hypothetical protein
MPCKTLRRSMTTVAVLVLLAASWAEAGARPPSPARAAAPRVSWSLFVQRLWTSLDGLLVKAGCSLDPSGAKLPARPATGRRLLAGPERRLRSGFS